MPRGWPPRAWSINRLADLDRGQPDPAGGAEHKQCLARLQVTAMGQREMRGAVGNRKGGGGDEVQRIGDRHHRGGVERDLLGIAAAVAQHRERPLPDRQVINRTAGYLYLRAYAMFWSSAGQMPESLRL